MAAISRQHYTARESLCPIQRMQPFGSNRSNSYDSWNSRTTSEVMKYVSNDKKDADLTPTPSYLKAAAAMQLWCARD